MDKTATLTPAWRLKNVCMLFVYMLRHLYLHKSEGIYVNVHKSFLNVMKKEYYYTMLMSIN